MKKKEFYKYLLLSGIAVSMIFLGTFCSDDDDDKKPSDKKLLLTEISSNNESTIIEYDNDNRLVKIRNGKDNNYYTAIFSYDEKGRLTSDDYCDYEYKDEYILKKFISIDTLYINEKGQLIKYCSQTIHAIRQTAFEYDSKGNLIKEAYTYQYPISGSESITKMVDEYTYTYDNKNGALSKINLPSWVIFSWKVPDPAQPDWKKLSLLNLPYNVNNVTSSTYKRTKYLDEEILEEESYSENVSYIYNADGYPVSGQKADVTSTYKYKEVN